MLKNPIESHLVTASNACKSSSIFKLPYNLELKNGQTEAAIRVWAAGIPSGSIMGAVTIRDEL